MSETIDYLGDLSVKEALDMFKALDVHVLQGFKDLYPDADVFIDSAFQGYLITATGPSAYDYLPCGDYLSDVRKSIGCSPRLWEKYMARSYKVVFQEGVIPYAYRS